MQNDTTISNTKFIKGGYAKVNINLFPYLKVGDIVCVHSINTFGVLIELRDLDGKLISYGQFTWLDAVLRLIEPIDENTIK